MLLEAQIAAFVGATLLLAAFGLAHQRHPSDFSRYWIAGWTFYVLRFFFDILQTVVGPNRLLAFGTNVSVATSAVLILLAVVKLTDRNRTYRREAMVLWGGLSGWTALILVSNAGFVLVYTPLYVAFGVIQLGTAYLFYQYLRQYSYSSTPIIIVSLAIWGLHKFDYPILRPIESVAPYGYILGALLSFTTGLGVMMFLLEDAERNATIERMEATRRFEEYEDLFNNIPDPVFIHDFEGNFLKVNDTAVTVLGYSRSEFHSMTPGDFVAPEFQEEVQHRIETAAESEAVSFDSAHVTADGTVIDVAVNAGKIRYHGQAAILAVARDVSERTVLEQRLSVVNRILRHDIRSAVNIIKGNAELAAESETNTTAPLQTVIEEADRLYEIAEKAQKLEGMQASRESLSQSTDISVLLESKAMKLANSHPDVNIATDIPEHLFAEVGVGFEEAIDNVLSNAIEHNDTEAPEIHIEGLQENGNVKIRIGDNGPGIPEDEIRPLRAGEETALQHTSGLGLWLVYSVIDELGGELRFSATEPRGTVVEISVPQAE